MTKEEALEQCEGMIVWTGFESAMIGIGSRCGMEPVAVYDARLMRRVLIKQGMTVEEAQEYLDFNVFGAYVGPGTPIHVDLFE